MSLTREQMDATRHELKDNFIKAGVSIEQTAEDLGTTTEYIEQLFRLEPNRYEDTWILKNYLVKKVKEAGGTPTKFTALGGNHHIIWFLNSAYIDKGKIHK